MPYISICYIDDVARCWLMFDLIVVVVVVGVGGPSIAISDESFPAMIICDDVLSFNDGFILIYYRRDMKQHKQPNYFGLTSSICSVYKWSAMVCRPVCNWSAIGLQLIAVRSAWSAFCVEHDRQNNVRNRHIYSHRVSSCT